MTAMVRGAAIIAGLLVFAVAFVARISNAPQVFETEIPQIRPLDDLYHLKRIAHSASNFPGVLDFDEDRGVAGAYCPWPPLYDLTMGGVARLFGATGAVDVLRIVVWIPPVLSSLLLAVVAFILWSRAPLAALTAGLVLALTPPAIADGWLGSIDHHFLEPFLGLGILGAVLRMRESDEVSEVRAALLLATALTLAVFVQPALVLAAGLAFACLYLEARRLRGTAIAFAIPAALIIAYRLTRAPDVPNNSWFLGWPHAAVFVGAAVAAAILWKLNRTTLAARIAGLLGGALATMAVPGAVRGVLNGLRFLGGDAWLSRIEEFRPVWTMQGPGLLTYLLALLPCAVLTAILLVLAVRQRRVPHIVVASFALVYLALALSSNRFTAIAAGLLAIGAGLLAQEWWSRGQRVTGTILAGGVVLLAAFNAARFVSDGMQHPFSGTREAIQVAGFLRQNNPAHERVLAPWSFGHVINVIGGSPAILDNFGTSQSAAEFREAHEILLAADEEKLAAYCRRNNIRYVVLEPPPVGIIDTALTIGLPFEAFVADNQKLTPRTERTWYWRAWWQWPKPTQHFAPAFAMTGRGMRVWRRIDAPSSPVNAASR
jgi:asparagine N-glycosylation enzyme membrane subunit Stt3